MISSPLSGIDLGSFTCELQLTGFDKSAIGGAMFGDRKFTFQQISFHVIYSHSIIGSSKMDPKKLFCALLFTGLTGLTGVVGAQSAPALNDPEVVTTVMQFTAKDKASIPELKKRMAAIRDFKKAKSKVIESVLMQNVNDDQSPQFVGVARWKTLKDWEALWTSADFQKLVNEVTQVGTLSPGVFTATK